MNRKLDYFCYEDVWETDTDKGCMFSILCFIVPLMTSDSLFVISASDSDFFNIDLTIISGRADSNTSQATKHSEATDFATRA